MIDFRFTGHIDGDWINVTFRTDALTPDDGAFNILQVKVGNEFSIGENGNPASDNGNSTENAIYEKYFEGVEGTQDLSGKHIFKRSYTSLGEFIEYALNNNLSLAAFDEQGVKTELVRDSSDSASWSL